VTIRETASMAERTLIIIKPDAIQRQLAGQIIERFEKKGFKLVAAKFMQISKEPAGQLYAVHRGKSFYEGLIKHITSAPSLIMVWEAEGIIKMARQMMGATFGFDAQPGTIRGDFSCSGTCNIVHGADSPDAAEREIKLFFQPDELVDYKLADSKWLYGKGE
jgi:nucleoside-diphosphate kinase